MKFRPLKPKSLSLILLLLLAASWAEATVSRVDYCGGQFTPPAAVPIIRGGTQRVVVRGDLVDTNTGIEAPSGITATKVSTTTGGGVKTSLTLDLNVSTSAATGNNVIKIHYLVEVNGPDKFTVNVKDVKVTGITPSPNPANVLAGTPVTLTVQGTGLSNLAFNTSTKSHFTQPSQTLGSTTSTFSGNLQSNININPASFVDSTMTSAGIQETCASPKGSVASVPLAVGLPDLTSTKATRYRLGPTDNCVDKTFSTTTNPRLCTSGLVAPTTTQPHVEGNVDVGIVTYTITNKSAFPMPNHTFKVQLKNGINVLKEDTLQPLKAGGTQNLGFKRQENRRHLMRDLSCPSCYDLNVAPFNWVDPQFTVVVDSDHQVGESNETNNTVVSD